MADKFFTKTTCDRCGGSLKNGRIMSTFNTDCICTDCKEKERHFSNYEYARQTELTEVIKGNYNFEGVGL